MKDYRKFFKYMLLGFIGFLFIVVSGGIIFLFYGTAGLCGNNIISSKILPDNEKKLVVFQRDCGATTGFSIQVSILSTNEELGNESGNLFIADTDHGKAPSGKDGVPKVRIRVISKSHIEILVHPNTRIFKNETQIHGINVSYGTI